ncbi:MAG TPA: helix-turn-helix transcriptional regulator [Myxococcota bacterium]|nr:helix-turn-helix transcriptional regulator [Myxococcota bacterium]
MASTNFKLFKQKALKDEAVKKEYDELASEFTLARELIKARSKAKMTQEDVAEVMHTSKSNISRLESSHAPNWPNLNTLMKYAAAVGCELQIKLTPIK